MTEKRRLRAGVEVEVDGGVWLHGPTGGRIQIPSYFTEPIPEERNMIEKRRLRNVEVEVEHNNYRITFFALEHRMEAIFTPGPGVTTTQILDLITEPIPEEEATGERMVTAQWLYDEAMEGRAHTVRNPDGSLGTYHYNEVGGHVRMSDGLLATAETPGLWPLVHEAEKPQPEDEATGENAKPQGFEAATTADIDILWLKVNYLVEERQTLLARIEALEEDRKRDIHHLESVVKVFRKSARCIEALEERIDSQEDRHQVLVDRVVALERKLKWVIESRMHEVFERVATLEKYHFPPQTLEIVEEKDLVDWLESSTPTAEGPSAEEVVAWLHGLLRGRKTIADSYNLGVAIRLIRAHEKPELTPEIVERAAMAAYEIDGASWNKASKYERQDCISEMEAALHSTEMFR